MDRCVGLPEMLETCGECVPLGAGLSAASESASLFVVEDECCEGIGPGGPILAGENETGDVVINNLLRSAAIADENRQAAGLTLEDDLAKCIGSRGKDEEIGRGVDGGEFCAVTESETCDAVTGKLLLHLMTVGSVPDNDEFGFDAGLHAAASYFGPDCSKQWEILLNAHAATVEHLDCPGHRAECRPNARVPKIGAKCLKRNAWDETEHTIGVEAERDQRRDVVIAPRENARESLVEPLHVPRGDAGVRRIVKEMIDVSGEVGVVYTDDRDAQHTCGEDPEQTDGAGCRDMDDIGLEFVGETQYAQNGRERNFEVRISRHCGGEYRIEVVDVRLIGRGESSGRDDVERSAGGVSFRPHILDEPTDAVDVAECVGEEHDTQIVSVRTGHGFRSCGAADLMEKPPFFVLMEEAEYVRRCDRENRGVADKRIDDGGLVERAKGGERGGSDGSDELLDKFVGELGHWFVGGEGRPRWAVWIREGAAQIGAGIEKRAEDALERGKHRVGIGSYVRVEARSQPVVDERYGRRRFGADTCERRDVPPDAARGGGKIVVDAALVIV